MYVGAGLAVVGEFLVTYGAAIGAVASVASTAYQLTQDPAGMDMPTEVVDTKTHGTPIDKTSMQADAELGKLQLGEDEMDKSKRKKGKAAFKIALAEEEDKKKKGDSGTPETGVQVAKPENTGAQL